MTSKGQAMLYSGESVMWGSGKFLDSVKQAHNYVKNNKVLSKTFDTLDSSGLTKKLNENQRRYYSQASQAAKKQGYGKSKRRKHK